MVINESRGRTTAVPLAQGGSGAAPSGEITPAAWRATIAAFKQLGSPRFFEEEPDAHAGAVLDGANDGPGDGSVLQRIRALASDRNVFLELGRVLTDGQAGLLGPLVMAQPSGSAAMEQFLRYQELIGGPSWTVERDGELVRLGYRPAAATEECELAAELALSAAYHTALRFWGPTVGAVIGVELAFPQRNGAPDHRRYFAGPLRFGASRCSIVVPRALFELQRPGVDEGLAKHLSNYAFSQWAARGGSRSWVARVETALVPAKHLHDYQLERVARTLRVSERTLRRRLAEEGTTFSVVATRMRDERAARFLLETDLSLAEIAATLGYSDPTSFRRACRNRFGRTPRQIRRAGFVQPDVEAQPAGARDARQA